LELGEQRAVQLIGHDRLVRLDPALPRELHHLAHRRADLRLLQAGAEPDDRGRDGEGCTDALFDDVAERAHVEAVEIVLEQLRRHRAGEHHGVPRLSPVKFDWT
jgi:hypothetical protein